MNLLRCPDEMRERRGERGLLTYETRGVGVDMARKTEDGRVRFWEADVVHQNLWRNVGCGWRRK